MERQRITLLKPLRDYTFKLGDKIKGAIARSEHEARRRLFMSINHASKRYGKEVIICTTLVFINDKEFERTDFHGKETPRNKYYKKRT